MTWQLIRGDARRISLADGSMDCVVTDPPYPEIDREYGRWTEAEWHTMMRHVVAECRRILKPHGSAMFVLQPNSERVGRMRPWLWEFMAWTAREWGQVQDAWWWNHAMPPTVHCHRDKGLARPSVKACVWLGLPDCYRNQDEVLLPPAQATIYDARQFDHTLRYTPSGLAMRHGRAHDAYKERGGVTPFNLLPIGGGENNDHPGSTPPRLVNWWLRYICPPGGTACDPFVGSGTTLIEAERLGLDSFGFEIRPEYVDMAAGRIADALRPVSRLDPRPAVAPASGQLDLFGVMT